MVFNATDCRPHNVQKSNHKNFRKGNNSAKRMFPRATDVFDNYKKYCTSIKLQCINYQNYSNTLIIHLILDLNNASNKQNT